RLWRAGGRGVLGQHAQRGAERAHPRQMVAADRGRQRHGGAGHGLLPIYRCAARRARSQAQMITQDGDSMLLQVRNLCVRFKLDRKREVEAVKSVSFDVPRNATVALVGESGSGKSVSSLAVMGLLPPETASIDPASSILFGGRELLRLT